MTAKGAYKRKMYTAVRDSEDTTQIDKITTKVNRDIVEQDKNEKVIILWSVNHNRQPFSKDDDKAFKKALRYFEPTIWAKPKGMKWCSALDHWVRAHKDYFSPDLRNADGFQPHCRDCRNAQARHNYATSLDREVRSYTRKRAA